MVIAETVDGEALIVNLRTGCYFSAAGTTGAAWSALATGWSAPEVAAALGDQAGVEALVAQAREEDLLAPLPHGSPAPEALPPDAPGEGPVELLRKFTDMQELLILDPVHDVDEAAGWPAART